MTTAERFRTAWWGDDAPPEAVVELLPDRLARAAATVLDVPGAGISVLTPGAFRVPLGASDRIANAAERLQFTHGAGPCLEAAGAGRIVHVSQAEFEQKWPALFSEMRELTPYRSAVSVPLRLGADAAGACDLYLTDRDGGAELSAADITTVGQEIGSAVAAAVSDSADGSASSRAPAWLNGPTPRRRTQVWIAIGLLNASLNLPAPDALARLRGYAYAHDVTVDDLAEALVARRLPAAQLKL
jgi:hypothetical protein